MDTASEIRQPNTARLVLKWCQDRVMAVLAGFKTHRALYAVALVTYGFGLLQSHLLGDALSLGLAGLASTSIFVVAGGVISFWLLGELIRLWRAGYGGSPTLALLKYLFNVILTPGRIGNGFHFILATGLFAIGFTNIKSNIPKFHPFAWDRAFMELDKVLHFGVLPHEYLTLFYAAPIVTFAVNFAYNAWFLMLMGFVLWQGFQEKDTPLRQRFFLSYLLCWALGTCFAGTIFSSAGPCFYGRVVAGPDPYAGLMAKLHAASEFYPIWALTTQDMLWDSYVNSKGTISGISAMPSMHVGTSVIFFLCARAAGIRWLTWLTAGFAVTIMLGSVVLAWHYAVDGYAGAAIAALCWWLAGLWVKRAAVSSRPS